MINRSRCNENETSCVVVIIKTFQLAAIVHKFGCNFAKVVILMMEVSCQSSLCDQITKLVLKECCQNVKLSKTQKEVQTIETGGRIHRKNM